MINDREIRVIGADGEAAGIMSSGDALTLASDAGLDLVEIAATAKPPVCRIMDYGKFKYEQAKKKKDAKKKQVKVQNKEIKLHLKTDTHDYNFKMDHAKKFLLKGNRVKVTMVFRGREIVYKDLGLEIMKRVDADLSVIAVAERKFVIEGRNMISNYMPDKIKVKEFEKSESAAALESLEPIETEDTEN